MKATRNLILLALTLSLFWIGVPRHADPVISTVGRASTIATPQYSPKREEADRKQFISRRIKESKDKKIALYFNELQVAKQQAVERQKAAAAVAAAHAKAAPPPHAVQIASVTPIRHVNWDRMSECEDNDDPTKGPTGWQSNTGNGYYGGLQFSLSSWRGVGGTGRPDLASREVQIEMAERLSGGGRNLRQHWPTCYTQG